MRKVLKDAVVTIAGGASAFALACGTASAQTQDSVVADDTASGQGGFGEIVVTAQRRSESIRDVPITIQAFTGDTLKELGVRNTNDIGQFTPNVTVISPAGAGNQPVVTIRGIGLNDYNTNNSGPNGIYVDEVYISAPSAQSFNMFDLERVEVLKGPQGTLYGRNTSGGAINFVTAKPSDTFNATAHLEYGSYDTVNFEGAVGGPLGSTLSGRIAMTYNYSKGYVHNSLYDRSENGMNNIAARAQLLWQPGDLTKVLLSIRGAHVANRPQEYRHIGTFDPDSGDLCSVADAFAGGCVGIFGYPTPAGFYEGAFNRRGKLRVDDAATSLRIDHDAGGIDLVSITAFEYLKKRHPEDSDGNPFRILEVDFNTTSSTLSQEFRASQTTDRYNWVVGLYGLHEILRQDQGVAVFLDFDTFTGPGAGDGIASRVNGKSRQRTDTAAIFSQFEYEVTDKLKLILGGRYTAERKTFSITQLRSVQDGGRDNFAPPEIITSARRLTDSAFSWRLGASYKFTPDTMLYGSASRGFKSGGFNGGFLSAIPEEVELQLRPVLAETVTAYEVGLKSSLFDRRLTFDISAFYNDYRNQQVFSLVPPPTGGITPVATLDNARKAHTQGIDAQLSIRPIPQLTLTANLGLLKARLDEFVSSRDPSQPDHSGNRLANAPKVSTTLLADWRQPVGAGTLNIQLNGNYRSKQFFDVSNNPYAAQKGYWLVNARVGFGIEDQHWEVAGFVRNLTKKRYFVSLYDFSDPFGFVQGVVGTPRIFGVEANLRF